jgi:hypothetical protein
METELYFASPLIIPNFVFQRSCFLILLNNTVAAVFARITFGYKYRTCAMEDPRQIRTRFAVVQNVETGCVFQ